MSDLFRKLNTLMRAKVSEVLDDVTSGELPRIPNPMNKKLDQDIETLRERINQAIDHEDQLQAKVGQLEAEIAQLDAQADAAVEQGQDAQARYLIAQMQRAQQRLEMARSDLREHQLVAQELIQRVNLLEATVADVRHAEASRDEQQPEQQASSPQPGSRKTRIPVEIETEGTEGDEATNTPINVEADNQATPSDTPLKSNNLETAMEAVSGVINEAQEKITSLSEKIKASQDTVEQASDLTDTPASDNSDSQAVDDDLTARRNRLSKR